MEGGVEEAGAQRGDAGIGGVPGLHVRPGVDLRKGRPREGGAELQEVQDALKADPEGGGGVKARKEACQRDLR